MFGDIGGILGFNRTFMELKVLRSATALNLAQCFNRTFMELKVFWSSFICNAPNCFNRTFMELKVGNHVSASERILVSIAPLWNWKVSQGYTSANHRRFQSHLYGIESWHTLNAARCANSSFNRTFMELKGARSTAEAVMVWVSIAPLWNWKDDGRQRQIRHARFNRTFMELKAVIPRPPTPSPAGFNRTFMELKDSSPVKPVNSCVFQSHLYGIERYQRTRYCGNC